MGGRGRGGRGWTVGGGETLNKLLTTYYLPRMVC